MGELRIIHVKYREATAGRKRQFVSATVIKFYLVYRNRSHTCFVLAKIGTRSAYETAWRMCSADH